MTYYRAYVAGTHVFYLVDRMKYDKLDYNANLEKEIWKDIKDYEGYYQISSYGRVKSLNREVEAGNQIRKIKERILKQIKTANGYLCVYLTKYGIDKQKLIHILVVEELIRNRKNNVQTNHIDGNKQNNYYKNLELVTPKENIIHAYKKGLTEGNKYGCKGRKIKQLDLDGNLIAIHQSISEAARIIGNKKREHINNICLGRGKTAHGYKWEYA